MSHPDSIANMNSRPQRVLLETARYRVVGTLVLPRDGYRSRLSDFLNSSDRDFISLTEVRLQVLDENGRPGEPVEKDFVTVARSHVIIATTADD
jgi:Family of unknown function (DUF6812)